MSPTILLIDNNYETIEGLKELLEQNGFQVYFALSSGKGLELLRLHQPNIVLLEVDIPERDGLEICSEIREQTRYNATYIIFYSQKNDNFLQISAFNHGADDFIQKPCSQRLLISKLRSYLRRQNYNRGAALPNEQNHLQIDFEKYLVVKGSEAIELPKKEFEILTLLYNSPGKVFSRDEIKNQIWGMNGDVKNRTIDVHVKKLREKIGEEFIKTIKGVGYKLEQQP